MRRPDLNRALAAVATIALLISCNGPQRFIGVSAQAPQHLAARGSPSPAYRVLFDFGSASDCLDGAVPLGGLILVNGRFYGTTFGGGSTNGGTVYSISPQGSENVVYSFPPYGGGPNGPLARLAAWKTGLYGTIRRGGVYNGGYLFRVDVTGFLRILHNFGHRSDGSSPQAALTRVNNKLYGTTVQGGTNGDGTVFAVDIKSGRERALHSFTGNPDGRQPDADLTMLNGTLYGTTAYGGTHDFGTVFSVNMNTGATNVLYSFKNSPDGLDPEAGLVAVNGTLYGTTASGGTHGSGTVFSVKTSGLERVLYNFANTPDGASPRADLIAVGGALYGTTESGGAPPSGGTLYSVQIATGTEQVLHSFGKGTDGASPVAPVTAVGEKLYGVTSFGGPYFSFCVSGSGGSSLGTVFERHT